MLRLVLLPWYMIWLIRSMFLLFPFVHNSNDFTSESLDVVLRDLAFEALIHHQPHTGAVYKSNLRANLAGMEVSVIRLRSNTLWRRGANFSNIHIPMKTLPVPYVRRIFIASVTKLSLNTLGKLIEIRFPNLAFPETVFRRKRCAGFGGNRTVFLGETSTWNV
ncbi:Phosphatidylinositol 3-kinase [Actinidia chinensis var. chinensis]|uniref:Phosphatidylinositol 3-kinase n=1 Tax=Actinidia chinensis var. chinensis TaxID=1590841 RepID=A0A2R6QN42_ACTCC|nr:Phosphatidylinositol 3-kinase [Actinidia chinensis var. chinensis]